MPAFGKRSEIGMNAEPMMPKACSMPCICKTFTKASSVVIFMIEILYLLVLKNFGELAGGIAKRGQMTARGLQIHARFRRLNGEGGEHLAVLANHRYRHADDADEILLPVERNLLFADLAQFGVEPGAVGNGAAGKTPELQALQQTAAARRSGQRQIQLADSAAMQRHARADGVVQPQRPMLRFDAVEIGHLTVEKRADIAGLV